MVRARRRARRLATVQQIEDAASRIDALERLLLEFVGEGVEPSAKFDEQDELE